MSHLFDHHTSKDCSSGKSEMLHKYVCPSVSHSRQQAVSSNSAPIASSQFSRVLFLRCSHLDFASGQFFRVKPSGFCLLYSWPSIVCPSHHLVLDPGCMYNSTYVCRTNLFWCTRESGRGPDVHAGMESARLHSRSS